MDLGIILRTGNGWEYGRWEVETLKICSMEGERHIQCFKHCSRSKAADVSAQSVWESIPYFGNNIGDGNLAKSI